MWGRRGQVGGSGWWGVRVDVNEELKIFVKIQKRNFFFGGGGWEGRGQVGGRVGGGVRVDVNAMLGVGVMWGMGM